MSQQVKKIRSLLKMGARKLTKLRADLTDMAWELSEKNQVANDKTVAQTLVLIDKSLVEIEKALSQLNSIWLVDNNVEKVRGKSLHNYKF